MKRNYFTFFIISILILCNCQVYTQEFEMPSFVHAIDACDMDLDGSNDIIVSCGYIDTLVILFNDGFGNFEPYYYGRITGSAICGCVDDDSIPDILAGKGQMHFYKSYFDRTLGNGIPLMVFSSQFTIYDLVDMNNDGWRDLIYDYATYWGIFKNNGDLTFTNKIIGSDGGPAKPSIGYFDNDPLPDIVVSYDSDSRTQLTKYLINNGDFDFAINTLNSIQYVRLQNNLHKFDIISFV